MNTEPFLDVTALEKLMQIGGKEFAGHMIDLFLIYIPQKLAEARTAEKDGDLMQVRKAVHPIKSSAWNIGAHQMRVLAARIEECAADNRREPITTLLTELEAAYEQVKVHLQEYRKKLAPCD